MNESGMSFSICPEMLLEGFNLKEKISIVKKFGFNKIDLWGIRSQDSTILRRLLKENGVDLNSFSACRESSATLANDRKNFIIELKNNLKIAHELKCPTLILLTDGLLNSVPGASPPVTPAKPNYFSQSEKMANLQQALAIAGEEAEKADILLCLEPLNTYDHPGYSLNNSREGFSIINTLKSKNIKIAYDIYHMSRMGENILDVLLSNIGSIGIIHFADVPGRFEPGTGKLDANLIINRIIDAGFNGTFEFECRPASTYRQALETISYLISGYQ